MNVNPAACPSTQRYFNLDAVFFEPELGDSSFDESLHVFAQSFEAWYFLGDLDEQVHVQISLKGCVLRLNFVIRTSAIRFSWVEITQIGQKTCPIMI